jgi:endoglucanase
LSWNHAASVCRYADALGDTFLFFESQHSGDLSSNVGGNRIKWRGQQLTKDGADIGLDLSGGMYEAGSVPRLF